MKVAFISNSIFDGAGIAAYRIFKSVTDKGIEGFFFTNDNIGGKEFKKLKSKKQGRLKKFIWSKYYWRKYQRPALKVFDGYDYFTVQKLENETSFDDLNYEPDIVHLHWINNILDYETFFASVPKHIPIVWTLHDMSPFTGGCIYSWDCNKFITECKDCPQLPHAGEFDLALYTQQLKLDLFKDKNLHLAANSFWLEKEARRSKVFQDIKSLTTIHLSIDTSIFKPVDKNICREAFGLSSDDFVICFGATYLNSKRKGLTLLFKALEIAYKKHRHMKCIIYGNNLQMPSNAEVPPFISAGRIESPHLLKVVYSTADIFIIPSLQEAFGQTSLESMSCGVPVVGFNVGGIPDMVINGETGLLAEAGNVNDLAEKIQWMIENPERRKAMGVNARSYVTENFSMEKQGNKYIDLYKSIINQDKVEAN